MAWICRVHGQDYTVEILCTDEVEAEATAWELLGRGVRHDNRIYPNTTVLFCELIDKGEE